MVTLLDSEQREMVYCACGVLVNLLADSACRHNMSIYGGIRKCVPVHLNIMLTCHTCLVHASETQPDTCVCACVHTACVFMAIPFIV